MLERPWSAVSANKYVYEPTRDAIDLSDILSFLRRYIWTLAICPAIALICAVAYLMTSEPIYTAQTQILIEPKIPQLLQQPAAEVNLSLDTSLIESQLAILRSQKIAMMVVHELNLLDNPDFGSLEGPAIVERVSLFARLMRDSLLGNGDPQHEPNLSLRERARRMGAVEPEAEQNLDQRAVEIIADGLTVQRVGVSYAVDIWHRSRNPILAARITNAIAGAFVREQLETRSANSSEGMAWLEQRIQEVRTQMNYATQTAQRYRAKHDYSVAQPADVDPKSGVLFGSQPDEAAQGPSLEELEVTAETYRKMYESLLQAYATSVNQQPYLIANARVITIATEPLAASYPRSKITLLFGLLAGLIVGIIVACARHSLDRTVRTPKQIREETDLAFLGEVPRIKFSRGGFGRLDEVVVQPHGAFSESLKGLSGALTAPHADKPCRCVGVTSVSPGDGKSTVASNLAALSAASGRRTLVIDADTNAALTTELIHLPYSEDSKTGSEPLEDRISFVASTGYYLLPLPAKRTNGRFEPISFEALLARLDCYQMIFVDLPSFAARFGRDIAPQMDRVILVADSGGTPLDQIVELADNLRRAGANLFGVVLVRGRSLFDRARRQRISRAPR